MAPTSSPQSARTLLLQPSPSPPRPETLPSLPKSSTFRFSSGQPPTASTSKIPTATTAAATAPPRTIIKEPTPVLTKAKSVTPAKEDENPKFVEKVTMSRRSVSVEPDKQKQKVESPVGGEKKDKGKEKAKDGGPEPTKSLMSRLAGPSDQKAGLNKRDPEEVKQIIYEASKGSSYFLNEQKKDAELTKKVQAMLKRLEEKCKAKGYDLSHEEAMADAMIAELEKKRNLREVVGVVDADAFYASCHELTRPELKGTVFAVGGGVICTASYEARKYGVRSAMAGFVAKKLCPHLKFIDLDFSLYTKISKQIMEILRQYGDISPASLDEAYCTWTDYCSTHNLTPSEVAERIREQVKRETGCTVSAGVSPNATISKIAADLHKPDGQFVVEPTREGAMAFMRDLPVRKIPGIGRVSERWLQALGVLKVSDMYDLRGKLYLVKDEVGLTFLLKAYLGLGSTEIRSRDRSERKSVSVESTFGTLSNHKAMYTKLKEIADGLASDLLSSGYSGRTVTLKIKLDTFEVLSRGKTLGKEIYFSDADALYREGKKLLDTEILNRRKLHSQGKLKKGSKAELSIRLIGLKMSNLKDVRAGKDGDLSKWKKDSKKSKSKRKKKSKLPKVKKEDPEEYESASDSLSGDLEDLAREEEDFNHIKMEEDLLAASSDSDSPNGPSSSDPLWAQIDGSDPSDYLDNLVVDGDGDTEMTEIKHETERHKPFFTGGPSINSRVSSAKPVLEKDKLSFENRGSQGGGGGKAFVCPVCDGEFVGSELAMNSHVEGHFAAPPKPKATSSLSASASSSKLKRPASSQSQKRGSSKKVKASGTLEGFLTQR